MKIWVLNGRWVTADSTEEVPKPGLRHQGAALAPGRGKEEK